MALIVPQPSACVLKLAPDDVVQGQVWVSDAPPDPAVVVRAEGPAGALSVLAIDRSRQIRIPYSEEELREFPRHLRERLRREGKIELINAGSSSPGVPFAVERGDTIVVRFEVTPAGGRGNVTETRLVLEGEVWGRADVPVVPVIGRGDAAVTAVPDRIRTAVAPGRTLVRDVTVAHAPVEAQVVAVLDTATSLVRIEGLTASRYERREYTDEELEQFPRKLREQARRDGYDVPVVVARAAAGQSLTVPAGAMLQVSVTLTAPGTVSPDQFVDLSGTLIIESNNWRRITVPIAGVMGDISIELSSTRIELQQGETSEGPLLTVRSFLGPATEVLLSLGIPGDPWTLAPTEVSLPARGTAAARLRIAADPAAATGEQRAHLIATWFNGLGSVAIPLTLAVRPGPIVIFPQQRSLVAPQGGVAQVPLRVEAATDKLLRFEASLPRGVTMLPVERQHFGPGIHELPIRFQVDRYAQPFARRRIAVHWHASDGVNAGRVDLELTVQLVREERIFAAPVITPDGVPLGGRVELALANDGVGRFRGHMRATGFPSFQFRVVAVLRAANGLVAIAEEETGAVYGTDSPGSREYGWDRALDSPIARTFMRDFWPELMSGSLAVHRAFEFRGLVGGVLERLTDVLDLLAGLAVIAPVVPGAPALAALVFVGSELSELTGVPLGGPGAAGLGGVLVAGAGAFIFGPGVIVPAFVAGSAAGALVVRHREVEPGERAFAEEVFGRTLPWERIRLTNLSGINGRRFVCPNSANQILVNLGDLIDRPTERAIPAYPAPGQVFIHELVHAWQITHMRLDTQFLWGGIIEKLTHDDYSYRTPDTPFSDFGIEEMGSVVDEWFSGHVDRAAARWDGRQPKDPNDRYFHYIAEHIRLARP